MLGDGPVFGLLSNKLSKSMLIFPGFFQVDPIDIGLLLISCFSVLLFVLEDNGCSGTAEGVSTAPEKNFKMY